MSDATKEQALAAISEVIITADVTPHLRSTATQLVFGVGSPNAEIIFVGEAPGAKEDIAGEPFIGSSGKFLNELLKSIDLERSDIYITNIVKYRPPENRDPTKDEIEAFRPYLLQQIEIIQPKVVAFLGRHSMNVFLPDLRISEVHGQPIRRDGLVYLPLYHPAAALYNGSKRQELVDDFAVIPTILDALN